ncbi:hypothetical protein K461DRAFT_144006 [Myriangium duriaei CBS 260.36]|uniref:Uncharacterized protein n=1 Tax=Myriangium duriaei CBS 260.36 TaxID=1168546 RepID=A0A9P4J1A6_9PEZI|nr:hypothetical protein K461DRAFT_144006 [Myriangium duriaei CBS 260.36]
MFTNSTVPQVRAHVTDTYLPDLAACHIHWIVAPNKQQRRRLAMLGCGPAQSLLTFIHRCVCRYTTPIGHTVFSTCSMQHGIMQYLHWIFPKPPWPVGTRVPVSSVRIYDPAVPWVVKGAPTPRPVIDPQQRRFPKKHTLVCHAGNYAVGVKPSYQPIRHW